ncbi:MAG: nicotinate-nicotinamide nucleotide adenylyltransferase [Polyangiaceae bacterium]
MADGDSKHVAVFGGSFNPPHMAHLLAIAWVLASGEAEEVVMVPTYRHPFAKALAPYDARVRMCELAVEWLPHERVSVSRVEEELGGESLTLRTLERFVAAHPEWKMRLVMGADLLLEADKWFRFDRVRQLAPPLVLGRVGFDADGAPTAVLPAISSTEVRARIAAGSWAELAALVPRKVLEYIREHRLYEAPPGD